MKTGTVYSLGALCAVAISFAAQVAVGHAQESATRQPAVAVTAAASPPPANRVTAATEPLEGPPAPKGKGRYYVDFRARTAASYGHAFVWYGRSDDPRVEVAGLHPATDSPIPYILGHILPVPAETGASYGDLDEQYVTAHYRVYMSEPDAKKTFAFIKQLQKISLLWHAPTYNCQTFIGLIANYMGLKTPLPGLYPEDYVNELRKMNGGRRMVHLTPAN